MHQFQLRKLQLTSVTGQQQLSGHLCLLHHGDLDLPGILLKDELIPQKRGASSKHNLVTGDLQLVDAYGNITEASLVPQEVHFL